MIYNRFTHLNKSQARAVAAAFTTQAENFRYRETWCTEQAEETAAKWGKETPSYEQFHGFAHAYGQAAKDAEERAAEAREIAEGKR